MTDPFFTRRKFLRTVILGGAIAPTVPSFVNRTFAALDGVAGASFTPATGKDNTILVVMQLAGGNDGLNTVIPYSDDAYFKARPIRTSTWRIFCSAPRWMRWPRRPKCRIFCAELTAARIIPRPTLGGDCVWWHN